MRNLMLAFLLVPLLSLAQKREITLEAIFKDNTFYMARPAGFKADETKSLFTADTFAGRSRQQDRHLGLCRKQR
jgi:hypothetical protein